MNQLAPPPPRSIFQFNGQNPVIVNNSVFGPRRILPPAQLGGRPTIEYDDLAAKNEVYRELGLSKEVLKEQRLSYALENPSLYRAQRLETEIAYADQSYDEYKRVYNDYLNRGYDSVECDKKAKSAMHSYFNLKKKVIEKDYPKDIDKKVIKKMIH